MKAITLTQPWATLVAIGVKRIETRSWKTDYKGPLAIHAAKGFPKSARDHFIDVQINRCLEAVGIHSLSDLPLGSIVALCHLGYCERIARWNLPHEPELSFGDYTLGRWAWYLFDIVPLATPIPMRGKLGLWNVPVTDVADGGVRRCDGH